VTPKVPDILLQALAPLISMHIVQGVVPDIELAAQITLAFIMYPIYETITEDPDAFYEEVDE
jgi:hypothetical protein